MEVDQFTNHHKADIDTAINDFVDDVDLPLILEALWNSEVHAALNDFVSWVHTNGMMSSDVEFAVRGWASEGGGRWIYVGSNWQWSCGASPRIRPGSYLGHGFPSGTLGGRAGGAR